MNDYREIGTFGQHTVLMSLEDLYKIADKEVKAYTESLEHEVGNLQWKLEQTVEALRFYAYTDIHKYHQDCGETVCKCLKEIEE